MQRSALVSLVIAALLAGTAARGDEPPSKGTAEAPRPDAQKPPPAGVESVAPEAAEAILGQRVTDAQGKDIGRLVDVLVDANGRPEAAVIDFGGFMGVGNRKIAVHWSGLRFNPADPKNKVTLEMTPDQIKAAPEFLNPNKAASIVTPAETAPSSR
jgi:PRC-barrel domain